MKALIAPRLIIVLFITCLFSCSNPKVESGEIMYLQGTKNYVIGTDSTFVIFNRETGATLNIIQRNGKNNVLYNE